ncbi:MAG: DUF4445 domain-containing protein [Acidobacteria bacterium]|nr:DUF4445 domain-containing protein [Acidobacteriota bacterium]
MSIAIRLEPLGTQVKTEPGAPLRDLLLPFGVEFPCGGKGRCRRCRVRVLEGDVDPGAGGDAADLEPGCMLACRARAAANATLEIGQFEAPILADDRPFSFEPRPGRAIAIDLGTTTVVAQLVDLATGAVLGVRTALNPQAAWGADVMTRIEHALHPEGRARLRDAIHAALDEMIASLCGNRQPDAVAICGNTAMLHLFDGLDPTPLSHAPFEPVHLESPNGFLPCIGGFVGSDILAGIVATGMHESGDLSVLIDLGTNGEVVVGNRERLLCASTAAGPAFEGGRISRGMRASTGAISEAAVEGDGIRCTVIGGGPARGICGSGLVDAVAAGLDLGRITPRGRTPQPLELADGLALTQADVRELQLAKAAIAGGVRALLHQLGAAPADVRRVWLAGAFGNYVNRASARRIGLLEFPEETVEPAGNTALLGAKIALFAPDPTFRGVRVIARHVPLGADPAFQDAYVDAMPFPDPKA